MSNNSNNTRNTPRHLQAVKPDSPKVITGFFTKLNSTEPDRLFLPSGKDLGVSSIDNKPYHVVLKPFLSATDEAERNSYLYNIKAKGIDITKANATMNVGMFNLATAIVAIESWNLEDESLVGYALPINESTVGRLPSTDIEAIVNAFNDKIKGTDSTEATDAKNGLSLTSEDTTNEDEQPLD